VDQLPSAQVRALVMNVKDTPDWARDNVRVNADDHVVQAPGDPPPLRDQDRLERSGAVAGDLQRHRADARPGPSWRYFRCGRCRPPPAAFP
jgi:hypothetical protein